MRQRPIGNFIVDFYCAAAKLVIEVDGDSHSGPEAQAHDLERTQVLEGYGLTVVRLTNGEVFCTFKEVCARIGALLGTNSPTPLEKGG